MDDLPTVLDRLAALEDENARLRRVLYDRAAHQVGAARIPSWWPEVIDWAQRERASARFGIETDASMANVRGRTAMAEYSRLILGTRRVVPVHAMDLLHLDALIDAAEARR